MLSYFSRLASEKSGFIKIKYTIKSVSIRSYSDQNNSEYGLRYPGFS